MLNKKVIHYCFNLLIICILLIGSTSSINNFINYENSAQSSENETDLDKGIINDFSQKEEEDLNFAKGLEIKDKFFTKTYHSYKQDNLLYICTDEGIMIYNCENMSNILFEDVLFPNDDIFKFEILEPNISIVKRNSLAIYNISNLKFPELIFEFSHKFILWFEIKNDLLFFYLNNDGVYVFNISNSENPIEVYYESIIMPRFFRGLLDNDTLILADHYSCFIFFFDVSNSESIELIKIYHDDTSSSFEWRDIVAKDDILIIEKSNLVTIYSYENITSIETLSAIGVNYRHIIAFENEHLYLEQYTVYESKIIDIYSLVDPEHPINIGESEPLHNYYYDGVDFCDNFLFLYTNQDIIYIVNITESSNFNIVSSIIGRYIDSICFYQNLMYASSIDITGIRIFNVSNPFNPHLTKSLLFNYTIQKMAVVDNYLIVASSSDSRFYFYNLSNPFQPSLMLIHKLNYQYDIVSNFEIKNDLIFLLINNEFLIIDIEIISNPTQIFNIDWNGSMEKFAINNDTIAVYSGYTDLIFLYNYSDKQDIQLLAEISCGDLNHYNDIVFADNLLIFSNQNNNIKFYDISNPLNPTLKFTLVVLKTIFELVIIENYLFLLETHITINVYKIDTNNFPVLSQTLIKNPYYDKIIFTDEEIFYYKTSNGITSFGKDTDYDQLLDCFEDNYFNTNKTNQDTDEDNMNDYFEAYYDLNPLNSSDRDLDYDFDNLSNYEESLQFSDPFDIDTDSDNLSDFEEFYYQTDPNLVDTDTDQLTDYNEIFLHSTNPIINDTDQDKLLDGIEILFSLTNPLSNDTDKDEMDDWWEYTYQLNPNDPKDMLTDLDLDGLTNYEEYLLGTYPNSSDSDFDNFSDKIEIEMGTDPMDPNDYPNETQAKSSINFTFLLIIFLSTLTIIYRCRKNRRRNR